MNQQLVDFLKYTDSQKEVSLVISQNPGELDDFYLTLIDQDFVVALDVADLMQKVTKPGKYFFTVKECLSEEAFRFIFQYKNGYLSANGKKTQLMINAIPAYQGVSLILLIDDKALKTSGINGKQILNLIGVTFRSN